MRPTLTLAAFLFAAAPNAQQPESTVPPAKLALVHQVLRAMLASPGFTWDSKMRTDAQYTRAMRTDREVGEARGHWGPDRMLVTLRNASDAGDEEVLFAGRQQLARAAGGAWCRRQGKASNGVQLPHVFEPEVALRALLEAPLDVVHHDIGTLDDRPVEIVTCRVSGDPANDLLWSGCLPDSSFGSPILFRLGAKMPAPAKRNVEVELAFFIDPASKRLLRLNTRSWTKNAVLGGGIVMVAVGGADSDDDRKKNEGEAGSGEWRDGLQVRELENPDEWVVTSYDVRFGKHGEAPPELDERARALLG